MPRFRIPRSAPAAWALPALLALAAPAAAQQPALDRVVEAAAGAGFSGTVLVGDTGSGSRCATCSLPAAESR
jgi:hypothetical protein